MFLDLPRFLRIAFTEIIRPTDRIFAAGGRLASGVARDFFYFFLKRTLLD